MAKDNDNKAMDVAKPGKQSPDTSGRPVLITHRPMVQDPMVNQTSSSDESEATNSKKEAPPRVAKTLQPVDPSLKTDQPRDETAHNESSSEAAAVVDAVAEQAGSKSKLREGELSPEDKAKQEHLQKLIADKTYFVSIGQVARRRHNRNAVAVLLLVIILALAGGYLLIDAGFIHTNIKLPVHFIKN